MRILYLYDMKLINYLKHLILEADFEKILRIFPNLQKGMEKMILFQTAHQLYERNGEGELNNKILFLIDKDEYESGVNTKIIVESIDNNFYKIFDSFIDEFETGEKKKRIIFVDDFKLLEDIFIEYILEGKMLDETTMKVTIITSAYSTDKNYFKKLKKYTTTLVPLTESLNLQNIKVVYLF